jgi:hypothetical protein
MAYEDPSDPNLPQNQPQTAQPPPAADTTDPNQPSNQSILDTSFHRVPSAADEGSLWDVGLRRFGMGTGGVIKGLTAAGTAAADVATWPFRAGQRALGWGQTDPRWQTYAPSTLRQKALDAAQLPTPQTEAEKAIDTFIQGASAAISPVPGVTSLAPTVANLARTAFAGGTGSVAGSQLAASPYVPEALKPTVDLLGNIVFSKAADLPIGVASKFTGQPSDLYQAFTRLGMDRKLVGTLSESPTAQSAEAMLSRAPIASNIVRGAQQRAVDQFGNAVENTANQLHPAAISEQTTGNIVQKAARDWQTDVFPTQEGAVWNPLNRRLSGTAVDPSNYRAALDDLTSSLNLSETQAALTPARAIQLRDALTADVPPGGNMTWEQAQRLRTLIGKTMGVPEISGSLGMDTLRRVYGAISQDMRGTAANNGVGEAFDAANQFSTSGHAFIDRTLSKIIRNPNPLQETITPEQATKNILNGGDTNMTDLRQRLPEAADALAAFKLRQAATAQPSQGTSFGDTSTGSFLTGMNRMQQKTPSGYEALYENPTVRPTIDDMQTVAGGLRETERRLNKSGTTENAAWYALGLPALTAAASGDLKQAIYLASIPPASLWGGGKVMTNPLLARFGATPATPAAQRPLQTGLLGTLPYAVGQ